jgi:hypothetical protein
MAVHFRVRTTDSMPERLQVTLDLERRYSEQEAAKQAPKISAPKSLNTDMATQGQR